MSRAKGRSRRGKKRRKARGRLGNLFASFLFGEPLDEGSTARVMEILGLLMVGLSVWLLLSMWTYYTPLEDPQARGRNLGGLVGHYLAGTAFKLLGLAGYLLGVLGICWGFIVVARKQVDLAVIRLLGATSFVASFAFLLDLGFGSRFDNVGKKSKRGAVCPS